MFAVYPCWCSSSASELHRTFSQHDISSHPCRPCQNRSTRSRQLNAPAANHGPCNSTSFLCVESLAPKILILTLRARLGLIADCSGSMCLGVFSSGIESRSWCHWTLGGEGGEGGRKLYGQEQKFGPKAGVKKLSGVQRGEVLSLTPKTPEACGLGGFSRFAGTACLT